MQIHYSIILMAETIVEDYSRVALEYLEMPSSYTKATTTFKVGSPSDCKISRIPIDKRVCHEFKECYIPFYECIFEKLGVRLPLTTFENEVLYHLRIPPWKLHTCAWDFVRVFKYYYECQGNTDSTFINLFFHLLEVNLIFRGK